LRIKLPPDLPRSAMPLKIFYAAHEI